MKKVSGLSSYTQVGFSNPTFASDNIHCCHDERSSRMEASGHRRSAMKKVSGLGFYVIGLILLFGFNPLYPGDFSNAGKEFYLCFQRNYKPPRLQKENGVRLSLFITASQDANVKINIESLNYNKEYQVKAGEMKEINIDPSCEITSDDEVVRNSIYISSDVPVVVYGLNTMHQTTDTYTAIPVKSLGMEYYVMCYSTSVGYTSQYAIIAAEDNTKIEISPGPSSATARQGKKFTLNRGEVFQSCGDIELDEDDLTGTYIKSDKKIAVFSGHQCAYVPKNVIACNHLVEQLPPLKYWGNDYVVPPLEGRTGSVIRILASENNTIVTAGQEKFTLRAGEFTELNVGKATLKIKADKPVLTAQFSRGFKSGDSTGDPMMMIIRSLNTASNEYRFATPINGLWKHYINITASSDALKEMTLDGKAIGQSLFNNAGDDLKTAAIPVEHGSHIIKSGKKFCISIYGFGYGKDEFDAYGSM